MNSDKKTAWEKVGKIFHRLYKQRQKKAFIGKLKQGRSYGTTTSAGPR